MKSLLFLATSALASGSILLEPMKREIVVRGLSGWGGYAMLMSSSSCPSGTTACGDASCCPSSYTCNTKASSSTPLCCPTAADCTTNVGALSACADNSWDLFSFAGDFCCAPDAAGTWSSQGRQCIEKNLPIPTSIALSTLTQVTATTGGAAATLAAGGSSAPASTTPASSSGSGSSSSSGSGSSSTSGSVSSTPTPTTSGASSATQSSNPTDTSSSAKSGLGKGAVITIAVLSFCVGILVAVVAWLFCRKRNRNTHQPFHPPPPNNPSSQQMYAPVQQGTSGVFSPPAYRSPNIQAREMAHTPSSQIYETEAAGRVELASK